MKKEAIAEFLVKHGLVESRYNKRRQEEQFRITEDGKIALELLGNLVN